MRAVCRSRVDNDIARSLLPHQIAVGARASHHIGVRCRQAQQVFAQRHGTLVLPGNVVQHLAIRADHGRFTIGQIAFNQRPLLALVQHKAWCMAPQQTMGCGLLDRLHAVIA